MGFKFNRFVNFELKKSLNFQNVCSEVGFQKFKNSDFKIQILKNR